jgi:hypothetical protein
MRGGAAKRRWSDPSGSEAPVMRIFLPVINETTEEPQGGVKPSVAGIKKA